MKKKTFVTMMMAALLTGCSIDVLPTGERTGTETQTVTFRVTGVDGWDVTRALSANGNELTDLWLFDYVNSERVQVVHLTNGDGDLSSPQLTMAVGTHQVRIVASNGGTPSTSGDFVSFARPGDTFWAEKTVTVADGLSANVAVTLQRMSTRLRVTITDQIPAGMASLTVSAVQWWKSIDATSGQAGGSAAYSSTATIPPSYIGTTGTLAMGVYGLSDSDEWMTDVTVTAKDADGATMGTVTVSNVPFKRNRATKISGKLFAGDRHFAVSLNDTWASDYEKSW